MVSRRFSNVRVAPRLSVEFSHAPRTNTDETDSQRHAPMGSPWHSPQTTMTHCVGLCLCLLLLLSHVRASAAAAADDEMSSAYGSTSTCVIRATLYMTPAWDRSDQDFGLPLDIDCSGNNTLEVLAAFDLGAQRVAGKSHVLLDGAHTPPLGVASYGLEYLDNCPHLQSLEIERFVGDSTLRLGCGGPILNKMTAVFIKNNELGTLSGNSFEQLPHLSRLQIQGNSLRFMEPLLGCGKLQELTIREEEHLVLRDGDIIEQLPNLERLRLSRLKMIEAKFFNLLPENLTELVVEKTPIEDKSFVLANGTSHLINVTIVDCHLNSFGLEPYGNRSILHLNLSGNALTSLELGESCLISLDLSRNQLGNLTSGWFSSLTKLKELLLQENLIHTLSLVQLLRIAPQTIQHIDLRSNHLMTLKDLDARMEQPSMQLRIFIDGNPWSCQWLLNFSHTQPQMFRLLQYSKYISHINVNGLSCSPQEPPTEGPAKRERAPGRIMHVILNNSFVPVPHPNTNVSSFTVLYGNPVELHRSQRSGALVIVFMLPLGIALLFLLLYLYLHCERLFHMSYYISGLSCFGDGKSSSQPRFVDHVDIVRYPIANGSGAAPLDLEPALADGYETPVSGGASICNCTGHRDSSCSRTHHVTYESLPTELPYQLYSEITELAENGDGTKEIPKGCAPTAPIYDHLSFGEEGKQEVELRDNS
ncbi:uncharacterized protein LOC108162795 [Drosophila miranda]|uniref:uncharacterized protein LOC108162795 n=1 Tax=Drosophila miranda TaxID=7229 RepID=UPI0007E7A03B|nr:uncharacterized protein LOC108162795 [Drosophila miranda]